MAVVSTGQITITDVNDYTYQGTTAPKNPIPNVTVWIDTSVSPSVMKRWTGTAWEIINEVVVGGRNLLRNTSSNLVITWGSGTLLNNPDSTKVISTNLSEIALGTHFARILEYGKEYTISFEAKGNINLFELYVLSIPSPNYKFYEKVNELSETEYRKVVITFKYNHPHESDKIFIGGVPSVVGQWLEIKNSTLQIEKGNKATDWTPAPEDVQAQIDKSIKSTDVEYYLSTSSTSLSGGSWVTTAPPWTDGKYMWSRTKVVLNDGTIEYRPDANGVNISGATGPKGDRGSDGVAGKDGKGITGTAITYGLSTSETTQPSTWTSAVPTLVKGQYLWTKTVWTYSDNTNETGYTKTYIAKDGNNGTDGVAGKDGVGIRSTAITYGRSTSGTSNGGITWTSSVPSVPPGEFLWTKTIWTYSDNTNETGYSVAKMGETGATGPTGNGISSITEEYYLSTSKTIQTGGSWVTTPPTWENGKYIWTRSKIVYTNSSTKYTEPIVSSEWEAVNEVQIGGRNLFRGYPTNNKLKQKSSGYYTEIYPNIPLEPNTTYTFSYKYEVITGTIADLRIGIGGGNLNSYSLDYIPWANALLSKGVYTFTTPSTLSAPYFQLRPVLNIKNDSTLYEVNFWDIKLEKGNKATDWTPAPEDIQSQIDTESAKVINLENKTDFLTGTTIEGNAIATGTLLVGNSDGTNAGITGLGSTSDGVYLWGGGTYQQMIQGLAKKEQRRNGIDIWRHPNGQIGFEIGIKDGRLIFNGYHSSGFKLFELDPNRGLVNVSYTQESWTQTPLRKLNYTSSTFNASTIASEITSAITKKETRTEFLGRGEVATVDTEYSYMITYTLLENYVGYDYDNGTNPANSTYESLKGMKANYGDRNTNMPNGWYMSDIGEIYREITINSRPEPTYTFTVYVYYYQDGKITQTKVVTITK